MKKVMFNDQVKEKLISGVNLLADAVETTYGPNGRNVIIKHQGGIHITKDGATVATYVSSEDPAEEMAIDVIREVAKKTAKDVGDGTTTSIVLARALINEIKNEQDNPIEIQRKLQNDCQTIIKFLEDNKKDINSFEDIKKVAIISTNNYEKLGTLIAEAFNKVGKYGTVNIGESTGVEDTYEVTEGMQIESGYLSPFFINSDDNTCTLENVLVYISKDKIKENKDILDIADQAYEQRMSLLIVAPDIESTVQHTLLLNKQQGFESCCIKSPNTGYYRDIMIGDMQNILGSSMKCKKVVVTKDTTTFIGCNSDTDLTSVIESIEHKLQNNELSEPELLFHSKRLANYAGGICTIKVGGFSEVEIKEKKDRIEDAICATKAALTGGVLPGGGKALFEASHIPGLSYKTYLNTPQNIITKSIQSLVEERYSHPYKIWDGWNIKTKEFVDLYENGVIDPFLVTKTALENAVSAASLILTNGCSIIYDK